jgi:hypothetical protein
MVYDACCVICGDSEYDLEACFECDRLVCPDCSVDFMSDVGYPVGVVCDDCVQKER